MAAPFSEYFCSCSLVSSPRSDTKQMILYQRRIEYGILYMLFTIFRLLLIHRCIFGTAKVGGW
jgi:hypothetical protein